MPTRVLIAGVSTRAAAESAVRAGLAVTAMDAFGDLDHPPGVGCVSLPRDLGQAFTPAAAARAARSVPVDAVAYLSSFENHPAAVRALSRGRVLWGNTPAVLRRVRDPLVLAAALRRRGFQVPRVSRDPPADVRRSWLAKPVASGGGHRVRPWRPGMRLPPRAYVQQRVEGTSCSILFVAAAGRGTLLAMTRQLVGEAAFGASGFRYCGSILRAPQSYDTRELALSRALVDAVAEEFALVGVGSVDYIGRDGVPYPIEVNPRWTASMELVERAAGGSVFATHRAACVSGTLPPPEACGEVAGRTFGKAVVFARTAVVAGDTRGWLADPCVRDVPRPGERLAAGSPVCTVLAEGRDDAACHAALVQAAARVYEALAGWADAAA